jgi:hypothetical protein
MDVLEKFLNNVSYKFPKGYPDMNDPKDVELLESLIKPYILEAEQSKEESSEEPTISTQQQELQKIIDVIDKVESDDKITKTKLFDLLAEYTYKYYNSELGDIKKVFPNPISTLEDWRDYVERKESNVGKEIEQAVELYSQEQGVEASSVRGKGTDVNIDGKEVEIKSASGNTVTTMLQTSFYKNNPNKFYLFASNSSRSDLTIRIVSSELLYRISLGDDIADELATNKQSQKLLDQINTGLETLDFPHLIQTSLTTGESLDVKKSFKVGKNIKVRFVIYIEPQ